MVGSLAIWGGNAPLPFAESANKSAPTPSLPTALLVQEAGMLAVRKNRYVILPKDFEKAYKVVVRKSSDSFEFYK